MKKYIVFKFDLDEHVFVLGQAGICIVTGGGHMEFSSGGKRNFYSIEGGHSGFYPECSLITCEKARALNSNM